MNETSVTKTISELAGSFGLQEELYSKLNVLVHRMYSALVLSRGDLQQVMGMLNEKQELINAISRERERVRESVEIWQLSKTEVYNSQSDKLNKVLEKTEASIKDFLDIERQLEHYLARLAGQKDGDNT